MEKIRIKKIRRSALRRSKTAKILFPIKLLGIMIMIIILFILLSHNKIDNNSMNIVSIADYRYYCLENGDNLWTISEQYKPEYMDIKDYMKKIKKINHISENTILQYGDWITIPIYE